MNKTICEFCKKIMNKNPEFIDINKLRVGMKLKSWFKTEYEPTNGEYSPCDGFTLIRKIDGDFIYHSAHGYNRVEINTRDYFNNCTEVK